MFLHEQSKLLKGGDVGEYIRAYLLTGPGVRIVAHIRVILYSCTFLGRASQCIGGWASRVLITSRG